MANPTNRQLWEMGVALDSAWLEFAREDDKRRYEELPTFAEAIGSTVPQSVVEAITGLSSGWNAKLARDKVVSELREWLLGELFNDELQAFAYRISPSQSRAPVRIEAALFDNHDPDWKHETLSARGIEYAEIRVIDLSRIANFQKPTKGRKGSAATIRNAIATLQSEGFDLCGIERKLACEAIRQKIGNRKSNQSGLSNENLSKYILKECPKRGLDN